MINKVILIGNLGKDPEVRYTQGGQAVVNLRVATSRQWTDKNGGGKKEETEWHEVEAWGKLAELCGEYLAKGRTVYVEGRLKTDTWEKDGQRRSRVKIFAEQIKFLGSKSGKPSDAGDPAPGSEAAPPAPSNPDDIPF